MTSQTGTIVTKISARLKEKIIVRFVNRVFFSIVLIMSCACINFAQSHGHERDTPSNNTKPIVSSSTALPNGWQTFSFGTKDVFNIAMPKRPETQTEDLSSNGYKMKSTYYTADSKEIFVAIADIHELPLVADRLPEETRNYFFEKVRDGLIQGIKTALEQNGLKLEIKFSSQKSITFKGISGYEQDFSIGTIKGRTRMLPKKDHIFVFFTLIMPNSDENLMGSFFDSFEYIDK